MASIKAKLCDVDKVEISVNFVCVIIAAAGAKNKQDSGWQISTLRRKTRSVFATFFKKRMHYNVYNHPKAKK